MVRLSHPNVNTVHDIGTHGGQVYVVKAWLKAAVCEQREAAPGL